MRGMLLDFASAPVPLGSRRRRALAVIETFGKKRRVNTEQAMRSAVTEKEYGERPSWSPRAAPSESSPPT